MSETKDFDYKIEFLINNNYGILSIKWQLSFISFKKEYYIEKYKISKNTNIIFVFFNWKKLMSLK